MQILHMLTKGSYVALKREAENSHRTSCQKPAAQQNTGGEAVITNKSIKIEACN